MVLIMPHPSHTEREHHHHTETAKASRAPSPKLIAIIAAAALITVSFSVIAFYGGSPDFEYDCDDDGNIAVRNTSSGMLTGASWNVFNYFTHEVTTYSDDAAEWNDPGDDVGPHVYKVTLTTRTYAGVERTVTKDVARADYRHYWVDWTFDGVDCSILVSIHTSDFINYSNTNINRAPGSSVNASLVERYVSGTSTSNGAFEEIVGDFNILFEDTFKGELTQEERINCIMEFVQKIGYATDLATTGYEEYWKFPIETLFAQGDCEDLAMLTMALLIAIENVPVAMFVFWNIHNSGSGHAMAAVNTTHPHPSVDIQNTSSGWYTALDGRTFYACETTAVGWAEGEMPPVLADVPPNRIIEINI
jgi:predicted transglutaminase-like cysteine proteinase